MIDRFKAVPLILQRKTSTPPEKQRKSKSSWLNNPFSNKNQLKKLGKSILKLKGGNVLVSLNKIMSKEKSTDGRYQYYRPFKNYLELFRNNGFQLIGTEENPNKIGAMYVFKKS